MQRCRKKSQIDIWTMFNTKNIIKQIFFNFKYKKNPQIALTQLVQNFSQLNLNQISIQRKISESFESFSVQIKNLIRFESIFSVEKLSEKIFNRF